MPTASGRIEGLDGLRALAVVLVIVYHLWPRALPGGFLGVDLFFVLSGFLITTLLLREHRRTGGTDFVGFWRRRAFRLLPALVTVVVVSVVAAWSVSDDLLVDARRQVFGALTFSMNWVEINAGSDYFDSRSRPLLEPLWSLAIEEQYYLFWPVICLLIVRTVRSPRLASRLVFTAAVGSALLMALLYRPDAATRVYYGTDTHLFGLMVGAALGFAFWDRAGWAARLGWQRIRLWFGFVALVAFVGLSIGLRSESAVTYRGGIFLASLCAGVMVAVIPGRQSTFTRVLEAGPLRWIGERSYGIYLWHWPTLLIASELAPRSSPGAPTSASLALLVVVATFVVSELSFRFVETPLRRFGSGVGRRDSPTVIGLVRRRPGRVAAGFVAVVAFSSTAAVALAGAPDQSAAERFVENGQRLIAAQAESRDIATAAGSTDEPAVDAAASADDVAAGSVDEPAVDVAAGSTDEPPVDAAASADDVAAGSVDAVADAVADGVVVVDPTPTPTWAPDSSVPPGDAMIGLGDSVMSGAAPALYASFPGILLEARPILQWKDAPAIVDQLDRDGLLRPVVVLNFGTNAGLVSEEAQESLTEVLDILGPERRVIAVTIVGISRWVGESNEVLRTVAAARPNVAIADWHAIVDERPDLLHTDRTHPNMSGIVVYADLIATTAAELGPG